MRFVPFLLLALSACGPTIQSGAFTVKKYDAERSFAAITSRAVFELGCPKEQIQLITLSVVPDIGGDNPSQVGAEGCGQRAVYVRNARHEWIMNTESTVQRDKPGKSG